MNITVVLSLKDMCCELLVKCFRASDVSLNFEIYIILCPMQVVDTISNIFKTVCVP